MASVFGPRLAGSVFCAVSYPLPSPASLPSPTLFCLRPLFRLLAPLPSSGLAPAAWPNFGCSCDGPVPLPQQPVSVVSGGLCGLLRPRGQSCACGSDNDPNGPAETAETLSCRPDHPPPYAPSPSRFRQPAGRMPGTGRVTPSVSCFGDAAPCRVPSSWRSWPPWPP